MAGLAGFIYGVVRLPIVENFAGLSSVVAFTTGAVKWSPANVVVLGWVACRGC